MRAPTNMTAAVGAGKNRQPWQIRGYLADRLGMSMADVARELDMTDSLVRDTIRGARNNRRVLAYLRDAGCPVKYLSLPPDMLEAC